MMMSLLGLKRRLLLILKRIKVRDPRPIQVATINVATGFEWMQYFNSGRSISPVVIKVHGITDADVAGYGAL